MTSRRRLLATAAALVLAGATTPLAPLAASASDGPTHVPPASSPELLTHGLDHHDGGLDEHLAAHHADDPLVSVAGAGDHSFLSPADPPARWNPCDYIDWKLTLDGAPRDGFNAVVEAVRRLEAASGLRFRYQGESSYIPRSDQYTEPGVDLTVAWMDHRTHGVLGKGTGLGGGWWREDAVDVAARPTGRIFSGFAAMDSAHGREVDAFVDGVAPPQRADLARQVMDRRLHLVMHELGHAIGLGHAAGSDQVMGPVAIGVTSWGDGDLAGIARLGAGNGCLAGTAEQARAGSLPEPVAGPALLPPQSPVPAPAPEVPAAPAPEAPEAPAPEAPETGTPFVDTAGSVHASAIAKVASAGITSGFPDGTFRPTTAVTRGQMASFLTRALGLQPGSGPSFADTSGSPHEASIQAVAAAGITTGNGRGGFGPGEPVTRQQMATFLVRALGLPPGRSGRFQDTRGSAHAAAIDALAEAGITSGDGRGRFVPEGVVDRGQMASFLARALGL